MRVALVTPGFPPMVGGGERYAFELARSLAGRGHEVTVVTSDAAIEAHFWLGRGGTAGSTLSIEDGLTVWRCPTRGLPGGRPTLLGWRKAMVLLSALPGVPVVWLERMATHVPALYGLDGCLQDLGPTDLIHAFNLSWEGPLVAAAACARRRRVPLVVTPFTHLGRGLGSRVARNNTMAHQLALLRAAAGVLALTAIEAGQLAQLGVAPERIHTVGGGLRAPQALPDSASGDGATAGREYRAPYALFLGRASRDKGTSLAMDALAELVRLGVPVELVIAGQPAPDVLRHYRRLPVSARSAIHLLGPVDEGHKQVLLRDAAMLVLPSLVESFGIVLLEAWHHCRPVIAARAGGLPDLVVDGVNGLLVPPDDALALATAMRALLDDPTRADVMGVAGNQGLAAYTWEAVAQRVEHAYLAALALAPSAAATVDKRTFVH
jgi:glycosyltransferase involved in cell wall biosynthesis